MRLEREPPYPTILAALHQRHLPEAWSAQAFAASLANSATRYLGWHTGAQVMGFCLYQLLPDNSDLITLVMDTPHQRRGLAAALLHHWEMDAAHHGIPRLLLEVSQRNQPAQLLYAKLGFTAYLTRPAYYPDGSDALCLEKRVNLF